ncbi:MAG: OmpA family protein [Crocinitomicaceae bacterium]
MKKQILFFLLLFTSATSTAQNDYFKPSDTTFKLGAILETDWDFSYPFCVKSDLNNRVSYMRRPEFLDTLCSFLKNHPEIVLEISIHTVARGSEKSNLTLSESRAIELAEILLKKGVSNHQLSWKGMGESTPLVLFNCNDAFAKFSVPNVDCKTITLTEDYINSFKINDKETFERLHQMNRRTEFRIVEINN